MDNVVEVGGCRYGPNAVAYMIVKIEQKDAEIERLQTALQIIRGHTNSGVNDALGHIRAVANRALSPTSVCEADK